MTTTLLALALAVFAADPPSAKDKPTHSPYAKSLPYLTKEEEDKLDDIIDRFMQVDIGRLHGEAARQALKEFKGLGKEAIPALIRGVNRAAKIEHSCPVVVIAQKLSKLLVAADDREVYEFAYDEIGSDVGRTRHARVLRDLKVGIMLRKNAVARRPASREKTLRQMSVTELADAGSIVRGPKLKGILIELSNRKGKEVLPALANAANSYDKDIQKLGRDLLFGHLSKLGDASVKEKLKDEVVEVRKAAVRVVVEKKPKLGGALIDVLADEKAEVREVAHAALVKLSRGEDFGPDAKAGKAQIAAAQDKWWNWWTRKNGGKK